MKLEELFNIIKIRKKELPKESYVASLYKKGEDAILQKIGEETTEVILAGKGKNRQRTIEETADLFFFIVLFMAVKNISLEEVFNELEARKK